MAQLCRPRSAVPNSPTAPMIPRASKAKASAQLPSSLRQQPFVQLALPPRKCTHPKSGRFPRRELRPLPLVLSLTMVTSSQLKTSRSPLLVILLRFFTFHSCGGRRSCSTLRTCCDGLQIGCSEFPKPQFHKPWPTMSERCAVSC